jgi:hypothetical protein
LILIIIDPNYLGKLVARMALLAPKITSNTPLVNGLLIAHFYNMLTFTTLKKEIFSPG